MKKLIKSLSFIALIAMMVSCEDNSKYPLSVPTDGAFVTIDIESPVIDVTDIENSAYGGVLKDPANTVESHTFSVRRVSGGVASSYADVYTTNTFPANFAVKATDIASALGLQPEDMLPGDRFDFVGTSVGKNGEVVTYNTLNGDLQSETGQRQAYNLVTYISCPFVQEDAVGTYQSTVTDFNSFPAGNQFEVIAGENSDELILVNPMGSPDPDEVGYKIVVKVNPFGIASIPLVGDDEDEEQFLFDTDATGNPGFYDTYIQDGTGTGFVFSCAGVITLRWRLLLQQVATGTVYTFGTASFEAQKIN